MGISMGGMVAQKVAQMGGDNVNKLILGCTSAGGSRENPPRYPPTDRDFFSTFDEFKNDGSDADRELARTFLSKVLGGKREDSPLSISTARKFLDIFVERFIESRLKYKNGGKDGILAQLPAVKRYDGTSVLPDIPKSSQTLILHAQDDDIIPWENAYEMLELLANDENASVHLFDDGGHFFFISRAHQTAKIINEFLVV
ncbi:hypothetical protein TrCOL_g6120 [Triparma columacea]|uniref:AB hydrolase-1 domain-containing protein n=1 Tax=Triparma columacea TaxID=722753 RepID=A0A9W7L2A0_9STRA|nr:hypothetical protein TrCOL_g6120 [Triparma columacea]